jgi:WD40 repeat protein
VRILTDQSAARALAFAEGGKTLVVAGGDTVRWWDAATGKELRSWKLLADAPLSEVAGKKIVTLRTWHFSPGAKYLAVHIVRVDQSEGRDLPRSEEFIVFDLVGGKEPWRTRDRGGIMAVAYSADSKRVAIAVGPDQVEVRNTATGKLVTGPPPLDAQSTRTDWIGGLALSADGSMLAVSGRDSHVSLWNLQDATVRRLIGRIAQPSSVSTQCLAFAPDGKTLLVGADSDLQLYDVATLKEVLPWPGHRGWVDYVTFSPDGKRLLTGSAQLNLHPKEVVTWDVATWKPLSMTSNRTPKLPNIGIPSPEHTVYVGRNADDRFNLYDLGTGKLLGRLNVPAQQSPQARGFFVPGGKFYVLAGKNDKGKAAENVYAVPSGKLLCHLPPVLLAADETLRPIVFSTDGRLVAVHDRNNTVAVYETATGKQCHRLRWDGWDVVDEPAAADPDRLANLALSWDGKLLVTWTTIDNAMRVWDLTTGKERLRLPDDERHFRVHFAWSPDGRMLAVGDRKIQVWEVLTRKVRYEWTGHEGDIRALAFSPDGGLLASGSADTTVLVWDVAGRESVPAKAPTAQDLESWWADLGDADARKAYRALVLLTAAPAQTLGFFQVHLRPVGPVDPQRLVQLVDDLNAPKFVVRDQANGELQKLRELARPELQKRLTGKLTLEMRKRIENLLAKLDVPVTQPDLLRRLRAVEVLEKLDTPAARQLLESLAGGAETAWLTQEARATLDRLGKRMS